MKKGTRKVLTAILAVVFVVSSGLLLRQRIQSHQSQIITQQAIAVAAPVSVPAPAPTVPLPELSPAFAEIMDPLAVPLAQAPEPEPTQPQIDDAAQPLLEINLEALRQVNPEVLGWIYIPETAVNYPLMSTDTFDEYLSKAWDGTENANGAIYLEQYNRQDLSDFNSIIYAHNNYDGTMFGGLKEFGQPEYAADHPYIYILTDGTIRRYTVFASYMATVDSKTYWLNFSSSEARQEAIDFYLEQTAWDNGVHPSGDQRIITLSTCSGTGNYTYRWVVHGVLEELWSVE